MGYSKVRSDKRKQYCEHEHFTHNGEGMDEEGVHHVTCIDCGAAMWFHFSRPDLRQLS